MRVVIINAIYGTRSSGHSVQDIERALLANGDQVCVAAPKVADGWNHIQIGSSIDYKIHGFLSRITGLQGYYSHFATKRLIRKIDEFHPDIVHIQVVHGNYLHFYMLMKYLAEKKIRTVFVLDDCWYFTGKCCHYIGVPCDKWKRGCNHCPRVHMDNPSWLFDRSAKMYRDKAKAFDAMSRYGVVAVSKWLEEEARQSYLKNANVLATIYNSTDMEKFRPRENTDGLKEALNLKDCHIVLGVATAWADSVGLSKGLDSFIQLSRMLPDDYRIVLVGKMATDAKLPDKIISVPFVNGSEELSNYYSMADVFVQMSEIETFGKVTAEALCCGTPVVVYNYTANPELVGAGCGRIVEKGNLQQMCESVMEIVDVGKLQFSKRCREFARENFDMKENTRKYIMLYEKLMEME